MKTIKSVIRSLQHAPLKSFLTLFTVGLGVGVLIFALGISQTFSRRVKAELEKDGLILNVANAEYKDNDMERVRPPQFDENLVSIIKKEISGVQYVAPITGAFWNEFIAGKEQYRIRSAVGSSEDYAKITGMKMIAGNFFTAEDVEKGNRNAVITRSLAEILFGSPENAIGKTITPPAPQIVVTRQSSNTGTRNSTSGNQGNNRSQRQNWLGGERFSLPTFTITGVYEDFSELKRKSYGLGDMVMPYTSLFPAGMNQAMARRFLMSTVMMSVKDRTLVQVESQLRSVLSREYGDDVKIFVWEGTPNGNANVLEETRQSLSTFSVVVNILGFLLLITGSIGILSIMLVEVLGKTRDIALERAMGAAKGIIVREYFVRSVTITFISVLFGIILVLIFARPLKEIVLPVFSNLGTIGQGGSVITPEAILISTVSALCIGGIFGILPLFATLQAGITEGLREV